MTQLGLPLAPLPAHPLHLMPKYMAQLPDQYFAVDAETPEDAQLAAFALAIARLSPAHFVVRDATEVPEWAE
jgi:hypothetical protein